MFNNTKSYEFFKPEALKGEKVNVVGCGAIGSQVAEKLCRLGIGRLQLWDGDVVAPHNLGNQLYRNCDIGKYKTEALRSILTDINPDIQLTAKAFNYTIETHLTGYVFLCIDNIDVRREFCTAWKRNPDILFITDGRMRLIDGTVYAADWQKGSEKDNFLATMNYTHDEAVANTPISACGSALSVIYSPSTLANLMVSNFVEFVNSEGTKYNRMIMMDIQKPYIEGFEAN